MSWLKHGLVSLNTPSSSCNPSQPCGGAPHGGDQLGVGCTDVYGASLNGSQPLGMRSEVNATTGGFPFPYTVVGFSAETDQRVKVLDDDVDVVLHPTATFGRRRSTSRPTTRRRATPSTTPPTGR